MDGLKAGLRDKKDARRRLKALAALCEVAPDAVFADKGLMDGLKAGLRDERKYVRGAALKALAALCKGRHAGLRG